MKKYFGEDHILPITSYYEKQIFRRNNITGVLELDLNLLREEDLEAYEGFMNEPQKFIKLVNKFIKDTIGFGNELGGSVNFNIKNFDSENPISELRVENIGKMVNIRGMITKTTKPIALVEGNDWECPSCGTNVYLKGDKKPSKCGCGRRGSFNLIKDNLIDLQEIELEESQDELDGKQPHKIRVRLLEHLTDKNFSGVLQPGNKLSVLGIVEKINNKQKKGEETIFEYRVLAFNIVPLDEKFSEESLCDEDLRQITEISLNNPLDNLVKSLAPSIFGHNEIKKALILQMVGGVQKKKLGGTLSRERIHLLLCGESGLSKTHLAKSVGLRMPKSYYISGDETSKAGLVAIVDRDPLLGNWSLKAGALSKANNSTLIIDEMDKLGEDDRNALHTPMESGEIVVNKADIHTVLKANCSILGIANPISGMFDLNGNKTITQQIDLPPPLMSRFDLIFVMRDIINKEMDNSIAKIIYSQEAVESTISIDLFRKYISYARKVKPKLLKEHFEIISNFYHEMRKKSLSPDSRMRGMPITPRHLEGLIRLSEASAKIRLSKFVEKRDILLAQKLFLDSLIKLGMDEESGVIDLARLGSGKTLSKKKKGRLMIELLQMFLEENKIYEVKDYLFKEYCLGKGIDRFEYDELIFELNKEGEIIGNVGGWRIPKPQDI